MAINQPEHVGEGWHTVVCTDGTRYTGEVLFNDRPERVLRLEVGEGFFVSVGYEDFDRAVRRWRPIPAIEEGPRPMTAARIWTLGDRLEYANGWQAEVAHVDDGDPHFAVVKKWRPGGGHYYETAHRDRPVPADDVADDTWSDPLEFDQGEFHTLDAAIAALPRAKGLTQ